MAELKNRRWELVAAIAIAIALVAGLVETLQREERTRPVGPGETAPALKGRTLSGEAFDGAGLAGSAVMVSFWATWCTPCIEELPVLLELEKKYAAKGLRFVAVNMDEGEDRAKLVSDFFANELKTAPPLVVFPEETTATAWKVYSLPTLYVLDRKGNIVASHTGLRTQSVLDQDVRRALGE